MSKQIPKLYVEGADDVTAIAGLLKQHGYDTRQGQYHLYIESIGSVEELLKSMPSTIKNQVASPCGFVLDIDILIFSRWQAVRDRLGFANDPSTTLEFPIPEFCPANGYIAKVKDYPHPFGIWLMPDCLSDHKKLEDFIETLIPADDPLREHAHKSTADAAKLVSDANAKNPPKPWECFGHKDEIKARVRTWLAWQKEPGLPFGAALNSRVLHHDSPQALAFLDWLTRLYGFNF